MNNIKKLAITLIAGPLLAIILLTPATATTTTVQDFDAASVYKAKCAMCHGASAEKTFDATKPEADHVNAVLKGVKPKMPSYETKGIDEAQAKALVAYMKSLKQ
jgi:mono/diheme cytochrome c family protein